MLSSFLWWTLCPRFLSICLLKDGTFSHHFKSQKTQFLQLFRPLSPIASPHKPPSFSPFQGAFFAVEVPAQIPYAPPNTFSFRGHPSRTISPSKSPAFPYSSTLSEGILCSRISKQNLRGDFRAKHCTFSKIPYFLVQISACPGVRVGRFSGDGLG